MVFFELHTQLTRLSLEVMPLVKDLDCLKWQLPTIFLQRSLFLFIEKIAKIFREFPLFQFSQRTFMLYRRILHEL